MSWKKVCVEGGGGYSVGFSARLPARTLPEVVVHDYCLGLNPQHHHGEARITVPSTGLPPAIRPHMPPGEWSGSLYRPPGSEAFTWALREKN